MNETLTPVITNPIRPAAPTVDACVGCLLGTALGDSIGLPVEGLSRYRQARLFGTIEEHRLVFGRGMLSDDTEHADLVARALIASDRDPERFARVLAWKLRGWFLLLPAGVGLATLKACLKLLVGVPPAQSGVWSAGNGPAMRAPLLGVVTGNNRARLHTLVRASSRLTHTDPRAEYGARAVAFAAYLASQNRLFSRDLLLALDDLLPESDAASKELGHLLASVGESVQRGEATRDFAARMGWGERITGYVYQTVPAALHAALSHPQDVRAAILAIVACGGDTDTTGAIVGGIVGAGVGPKGLPNDWLAGIADWPRTPDYLTRLGEALATGRPAPGLPILGVMVRNFVFTLIVLAHGFRRLVP